MTRGDWFAVGLKLLGVYLLVTGVQTLGDRLLLDDLRWFAEERKNVVVTVLPSVIRIAAGFVMVRCTTHCLRWCGEAEAS